MVEQVPFKHLVAGSSPAGRTKLVKIFKEKAKKYYAYLLLTGVFILSLLSSYFLQTDEFFRGVLALPSVASLLSIIYKIWRENLAHERASELQNKQQDFALGTASHMATVAYNKHVIFCECYMNRVQKGFQELLREGPSENAMNIGSDLVRIRKEHSCWLTKEIEKGLEPFEHALIKIGAKENYLKNSKLEIKEQRERIVSDIFHSFGLILGDKKPLNEEEAMIAIDEVTEKIREILGIRILTELRLKSAELALKRIS